MVENNVIINALTKRYDKMRMDAQNTAFEVNAMLESDPVWQDNRYKIKGLKLDIAKAEYNQNHGNLPVLKQQLEKLLIERAQLLKQKGLTEEDLKVKFSCPVCGDTGFLEGGGVCSCFYKNLTKVCEEILAINTPNLPTFKDFKETEENKKRKDLLLDYVDKFPSEIIQNLIFIGGAGTGKTFTAGCIASAIKQKNRNVIYLTAVKLNDIFLRYHTCSIGDKQAIFSLLTSCDLLVIDDLGTEPILKNVTVEYITATISERLANKSPFIITTNLNLDELKERYNERFLSRISGSQTARFTFESKDLRVNKK